MPNTPQHPFAAFTARVVELAAQGHKASIKTPSKADAIRLRFRFYSWRKRAPGVPLEAHNITISILNNELIATLDNIDLATTAQPFLAQGEATPLDIPDHLRALITQAPEAPRPLADDVPDTMNDAVKKLFKD